MDDVNKDVFPRIIGWTPSWKLLNGTKQVIFKPPVYSTGGFFYACDIQDIQGQYTH